ncbi:MAG: M20/M25/M40 family metallo-hydrolase [Pyrinomonadaceae bacterium]
MQSLIGKTIFLVGCLFVLASAVTAQTAPVDINSPKVKRALEYIKSIEPETIEEQIKTAEIPAPTFKEGNRAKYYKQRFTELGLSNVRIDAGGNVIGERRGSDPSKTLVIAAHLDTVFPEGTDVKVKRDGNVLTGAGIGDDARGLAVLLAIVRALNEAKIETKGNVIFVADVGEEGLGNLNGVGHIVMEELKGKITHFIGLDASGYDIVNREIGSNRYRVTFRGPGGHSYFEFGRPSAIHALGRAIDKIAKLTVPKDPRTTYNVGKIEGGTTVNSIAQTASMEVDLRSISAAELARLDASFKQAVQTSLEEENSSKGDAARLTVEIQMIGQRPVGLQAGDAPIVQAILAADKALGITSNLTASSTDSGMPMRFGIPAVTIGSGGRWQGMHSVGESFDMTDSYRGTQRVLTALLAIVGMN